VAQLSEKIKLLKYLTVLR